jgi:hypothetical protein
VQHPCEGEYVQGFVVDLFFEARGLYVVTKHQPLFHPVTDQQGEETDKVQDGASVSSKVFVVFFINTAVINLLVNANFGDFSRDWYVKVGATFVLTMTISIGSPHGLYLLFRYPLALFKRRFGWKKHKIQGDLNQIMIGPEFIIEVNTAINLSIVFTCFLYSSGMPFLNIICFFVLLIRYWVEKWLVIRYFKKPPIYKEEINNKALNILPFAGMLHCLFGLYMYGTEDIFPRGYNDSNFYIEGNEATLSDRMEMESGIIFLVLFAVGFAIWLLDALLHRQILLILSNVFKMNIGTSMKYKTFSENFEDIQSRGIAMYNIWKNPDYAPLVKSMNELAAEINCTSGGSLNTPITALHIERIRPMLYRTERVDSSHRLISSSHESPRNQEEIRMEPGASEEGRSHSEVSSDQPAPYEAERVNDPSSSHQLSSSSQSHSGNASHIEESPRNEEESRGEPSFSEEERSYREDSSDQPALYSVPYDPRTELDDGPEAPITRIEESSSEASQGSSAHERSHSAPSSGSIDLSDVQVMSQDLSSSSSNESQLDRSSS